jgi:long-chain fatty acid transport protein
MVFARLSTLSIVALLGSSPAFATDGYFALSYSVKSQGMGGVGIALPQDGLAAATNPAGTAFVEDRADVGLTWFSPDRHATITGNNLGPGGSADGAYSGNGKRNFYIPELGYVRQVSPTATLGIAIYGNGGMNTEYADNPFARFGGTGAAGVNLEQLFVSPSLTYRLNKRHAVGVAVNFAYQRFSAQGLGAFAQTGAQQVSIAPGNVTNRGADGSTGWGVFLLIWTIIVGTMDNFLRPFLIKRGADLPLLLIFAGVIGGLLGFGLVGIFAGPVLLAVAYTLMLAWLDDPEPPPAPATGKEC